MIYVLYTILLALLAFLTTIVVRTLSFKPKKTEEAVATSESFDREKAISSLGKLVRCKTISRYDKNEEDDSEFEKLYALLPELYPNVYKTCELIRFEDRGLLYRWKGRTESLKPIP